MDHLEIENEIDYLSSLKANCHDDRLVIRAMKSGVIVNGKRKRPKLGFTENWHKLPCVTVNRDRDNRVVIAGYYSNEPRYYPKETKDGFMNFLYTYYKRQLEMKKAAGQTALEQFIKEQWMEYIDGPVFRKPERVESMPEGEQRLWTSYPEKMIPLSDDQSSIKLVKKGHGVDLNICSLPEHFGSRYRIALDAMVDISMMGVLPYRGRATTREGRVEAIRHHLKAKGIVAEYEHNWHLTGPMAYQVFVDLKRHDKGLKGIFYKTTSYLKTSKGDNGQYRIKCYDVSAKIHKRDFIREDDWFKVEITFLPTFFRKKKIQDVNKFTSQPAIQDFLMGDLRPQYRYVVNRLSPLTKKALMAEYGVSSEAKLIDAILTKERTQTEIHKRLDKLNKLKRRFT